MLKRKGVLEKMIEDKNLDIEILKEEPLMIESTNENDLESASNENGEGWSEEELKDEFLSWSKKHNRLSREYYDWVSRDYSLKVQSFPIPKSIYENAPIDGIVLHDIRVPSRNGFRKIKTDSKTKKFL